MKTKRTDDGWLVFLRDDGTEAIRIQIPPGGITQAEVEAFKRHLLAHLHGAN